MCFCQELVEDIEKSAEKVDSLHTQAQQAQETNNFLANDMTERGKTLADR